jgi:hypothetical protein
MRLDIAERLICPEPHARTPLIVVAMETRGRDVIRAEVGCMQCRREWQIAEGTLRFTERDADATTARAQVAPTDALLLRLEALLGVSDPGAVLLLGGLHTDIATALVERNDAVVAVLPATGASPAGIGHVALDAPVVPFSEATFAAALLDASMSDAQALDAVRCVRAGGRVVGTAQVTLPPNVRELARDAEHWVGEAVAPPGVVPLRRA